MLHNKWNIVISLCNKKYTFTVQLIFNKWKMSKFEVGRCFGNCLQILAI